MPTRVPLPPDWQPTEDDIAYAIQCDVDPQTVLRDFRAYWTRATGDTALAENWSLSWVRWVRRESQYRAARSTSESSAPRSRSEISAAAPVASAGAAMPDPRLADIPPDMRPQVAERLNSIESRPIWLWALEQEATQFVWDETGPVRTPGFTLGRGILNRVIVEMASAAQLPAVGRRDCEIVAQWVSMTEHTGDAVDIALHTVTAMRARWRSETPPYSLVPFDADVRRAIAGWNAARAERMQRRSTAEQPHHEQEEG